MPSLPECLVPSHVAGAVFRKAQPPADGVGATEDRFCTDVFGTHRTATVPPGTTKYPFEAPFPLPLLSLTYSGSSEPQTLPSPLPHTAVPVAPDLSPLQVDCDTSGLKKFCLSLHLVYLTCV
eukprot:XP_001703809.1 predicted protein [Chlamydomonas reinhardtii]